MRFFLLPGVCLLALNAQAQLPVNKLWAELQAKRDNLPSLHQEFEVVREYKTTRGVQSSQREVIVDMARGLWRERSVSGSADRIRIFDGQDVFFLEEGGGEYITSKRPPKKDVQPAPGPYYFPEFEWSKAREMERRPCGLAEHDHTCVVLLIPLKKWARMALNHHLISMRAGAAEFAIDNETGLLIQSKTQQVIGNENSSYESDVVYSLKKERYGAPADASLFKLPPDASREVKALSPWNAARIRKELVGKPAPELAVTDINGNLVSLSDFKGRTVLLDFWASWCPPCRADAPSIEKLNTKYGGKELAVIALSVSEEREIVEKYLKENPHRYPIALTTENEMPRPYQIGVFPTYLVIGPDGNLASAIEGDQGFRELRQLLKKAGMDTD